MSGGSEFREPQLLGLSRAFEMISAPPSRTFHYRREDKRVIEAGWKDLHRLHKIPGPLIYMVTDFEGVVRYVGKWVSQTPLFARWYRHDHIHHQTSSRKRFLEQLDCGRSPLTVWSASADELLTHQLPHESRKHSKQNLIENLEALWIDRWAPQLWNRARPKVAAGFTDGNYWQFSEQCPDE